MTELKKNETYQVFVADIKKRIKQAQYEALRSVNKELVSLYWDIGNMIVEKQDEHKWGDSVVENLANDLQIEFNGMKGFSVQNVWRMRQFYMTYKDDQILSPMVREFSWTKNIVIMMNCKEKQEKLFYIEMTKKFGWTKNVLIHQIDNNSYQKYLSNQTNFDKAVPDKYQDQAKLAVKDEYTFDFLELGKDHNEYELEQALMSNMRRFLVEMGGDMCFVGNQYRLEIEDEEFFVDLLLYHREIKSLIAIEMKVGKFRPEYAGKMQFYLSVLDDRVKKKDENASIGIIICRDKKKTIVEYTLKDINKPIGVSTYKMQKELPEKLAKYLPSGEELAEKLGEKIDQEKNS